MFYFLKEIIDPEEVKKFTVSYNAELEVQMIELYNKYYDHVTTKYPFNKKLSDEEFKELAKGVFIAFVTSCLSEEDSKNIDMYHLYIIKLCYTFCVARGFHITDEYAEFLDKIMTDLVSSELNKEMVVEFNNSMGSDDSPRCDKYINDNGFIENLYRQDIRNLNKDIIIKDLKRFKYENIEIFKFFFIPDNFVEGNQKVNLIYKKYLKWCKKWLRPIVPQDEEEDNQDNQDNQEDELNK
jgi:hypothetical protein